jgi:hypothetical protein
VTERKLEEADLKRLLVQMQNKPVVNSSRLIKFPAVFLLAAKVDAVNQRHGILSSHLFTSRAASYWNHTVSKS